MIPDHAMERLPHTAAGLDQAPATATQTRIIDTCTRIAPWTSATALCRPLARLKREVKVLRCVCPGRPPHAVAFPTAPRDGPADQVYQRSFQNHQPATTRDLPCLRGEQPRYACLASGEAHISVQTGNPASCSPRPPWYQGNAASARPTWRSISPP